jgi:hypothetical protein
MPMTHRDNLIAALDGQKPEWIPYTVNQEFVTDDPAWEAPHPLRAYRARGGARC